MNFEDIVKIINPFIEEHIFYIGQTDDPMRRITEHYKSKKVMMLIPLCKSNKSVIDSYEQKLIKEYCKHKNNMNLMVKINPKESNDNVVMNDDNGTNNDQYVYIAFKEILELDNEELIKDALVIKKVSNRIKVFKYCEKDEEVQTNKQTITYDDQLKQCIEKINPYILQNCKKYQFMHIGKCDDYNSKKCMLNNKGITNIKMIKKLLKNNEHINQLKIDLCKYYENNEHIKLGNKNTFLSKIFKGKESNNTIYVYFY